MLEWSAFVSADDAGTLASSLAGAVDGVRYTLPEIGIAEWSTFARKLAGVMAAPVLLKDSSCERLLAWYDGDDDSPPVAAVSAAANGVPSWEVRQALASIGEEARELAGRSATWNEQFARDRSGRLGNFLVHLLAISGAATETP